METQLLTTPRKRETHYVQNPNVYEVGACRFCGGRNIEWSEFKDYIWCFDCEVDYFPEHWGIFDGPIPVRAAMMLGISFDRIDIATGNLIPFDLN